MFSIGDNLSINIEYVKNVAKKVLIKSTLDALGYLSNDELIVLQQGRLPEGLIFLQVIAKESENSVFRQNTTLFFPSTECLSQVFTNLSEFRRFRPVELRAFNNYQKIKIPAFHIVKIICFSKTIEAYVIEYGNQNDAADSQLAITEEVILPGLFGKITQLQQ